MSCARVMRNPPGRLYISRALGALLVWPALFGPLARGADKYTLDLTDPRIRQAELEAERACKTFSGAGGGSSAPWPKLGLALELVGLDRRSYRLGDDVTAVLRLKNIGNGPVAIPWSWDRRAIYVDYCSAKLKTSRAELLEALPDLRFTDAAGLTSLETLHYLYGALDDPATYRVLDPDESALIKAKAVQLFYAPLVGVPPGYRPTFPQEFFVTAGYDARGWKAGPYNPIQSTNAMKVTVSQRETGAGVK